MSLKVFISEQTKEWKQVKVPNDLQTHSQIMSWVSNLYDSGKCKGFLISENPSPYPISGR